MTTTPATLSDQTLAFTRMLVGANLAEGITTTIPSGDLYNIIDELIRLRSRPNEGMAAALSLAIDFIREEGEVKSLSDEKWRALILERLNAALPAAVAPASRNLTTTEVQAVEKAFLASVKPVPAPIEQARGEEDRADVIRSLTAHLNGRRVGDVWTRAETLVRAIAALSAPSPEDAREAIDKAVDLFSRAARNSPLEWEDMHKRIAVLRRIADQGQT